MKTTTQIGRQAEALAARYLQSHGYQICARNVRTRYYEIDLIARTAEDIVFAEVKYRRSAWYGGGESSVDARKAERLIRAAVAWLAEQQTYQNLQPRIDVITVTGEHNVIQHYQNAITLD